MSNSQRSDDETTKEEHAKIEAERQFLWARFKHNQHVMQTNPEFKRLLDKQSEWSEEDAEAFKSLLGTLNITG